MLSNDLKQSVGTIQPARGDFLYYLWIRIANICRIKGTYGTFIHFFGAKNCRIFWAQQSNPGAFCKGCFGLTGQKFVRFFRRKAFPGLSCYRFLGLACHHTRNPLTSLSTSIISPCTITTGPLCSAAIRASKPISPTSRPLI